MNAFGSPFVAVTASQRRRVWRGAIGTCNPHPFLSEFCGSLTSKGFIQVLQIGAGERTDVRGVGKDRCVDGTWGVVTGVRVVVEQVYGMITFQHS